MNAVSSIGRSGMTAAIQQLDSASHNIANTQTPQFRRETVSQRELPNGGVATTVDRAQTEGNNESADVVHQISSTYSFKANLHTVRTEQDMMGTLINLQA
jgi:flagellar hook protein FlgE